MHGPEPGRREKRTMRRSALFENMPAGKVPGESTGVMTAISFGDEESEFLAALRGTAVADHSMFGRITVTGKDRIDLLHRLSTNALSGIAPGEVAGTVFVSDKGRIIDSVTVSAREDSLFLITSPGAELFLTHWIEKYTITEDIRFETVTADTVMISLIGSQVISKFSDEWGLHLAPNACATIRHGGAEVFLVDRSDGSTRFMHLITGNEAAGPLTRELPAVTGARWIGTNAYEGFRIAEGIPARPGELNENHNPFECGLRGSISFTKGCYIGQEVIARLDTYGKVRRTLRGIRSAEKEDGALPLLLTKDGTDAGVLTSMTHTPFGGAYLGLAVLRDDAALPGDVLRSEHGAPLTVTPFPSAHA